MHELLTRLSIITGLSSIAVGAFGLEKILIGGGLLSLALTAAAARTSPTTTHP